MNVTFLDGRLPDGSMRVGVRSTKSGQFVIVIEIVLFGATNRWTSDVTYATNDEARRKAPKAMQAMLELLRAQGISHDDPKPVV